MALAPQSAHAVTIGLAELVAPLSTRLAAPDFVPDRGSFISQGALLAHSPPDLCILNATLLI